MLKWGARMRERVQRRRMATNASKRGATNARTGATNARTGANECENRCNGCGNRCDDGQQMRVRNECDFQSNGCSNRGVRDCASGAACGDSNTEVAAAGSAIGSS